MRFKLDENMPTEAADVLRAAGHDAATVREQDLSGEPDSVISAVCRVEQRALVTLDTDFADLRRYPPEAHSGIVVLRLRRQDRQHVVETLQRLVPLIATEPLAGFLWIVARSGSGFEVRDAGARLRLPRRTSRTAGCAPASSPRRRLAPSLPLPR